MSLILSGFTICPSVDLSIWETMNISSSGEGYSASIVLNKVEYSSGHSEGETTIY